MDKDVSNSQDDAVSSEKKAARERRRQSLLDRMMGAKSKKSEEMLEHADAAVEAVTDAAIQADVGEPEVVSTSDLPTTKDSEAPAQRSDAVDTGELMEDPNLSAIVQPLAVPQAPLVSEIRSATSQAMREMQGLDVTHDDEKNETDINLPSASEQESTAADVPAAPEEAELSHTEPDPILKHPTVMAESKADSKNMREAYTAPPKASSESSSGESDKAREALEERLQNQIYRLKTTISTVEQRFLNAKKIHKDQYGQLRSQLEELAEQVMSGQETPAMQQELTDTVARAKSLMSKLPEDLQAQWEDKASDWQAQVTRWTDQLADHEQHYQGQQAQLAADQQAYQSLTERLAQEKENTETLRQELLSALADARAQKTTVLADYDALKKGFNDDRAQLDEKIEQLQHWREEGQKMLMLASAARKAAKKYNGLSEERLALIEKIAKEIQDVHQDTEAQHSALTAHREFIAAQNDQQKALQAKIAEESEGLAKLGETFEQTEKNIQDLKSQMHTEADRVSDISEHVAEQAQAVEQHLDRIYEAVSQYDALEDTVDNALQRLDSALLVQQEGLEKVDQLEQRFDATVASVVSIQDEWQARDEQWQQRCSANDENYRNLVALLDRSRQNEAALEDLLASVKALEQRSDDLVQTAQAQCERQADMQMDLAEEQSRWDDLIAQANQRAHEAKTAAQQAKSTLAQVNEAEAESQKRQEAQAQANAAVVQKVDRAQEWIEDAVAQTQAWQKEADAAATRQAELAEQCEQLFEHSLSQGEAVERISETAKALSESTQGCLAQTQSMATRVDAALAKVTETVTEASEQHDALVALAKTTQKQINDMLAENRALANQSRTLQHRVSDQTERAEVAQAEIESALSRLQTHQTQADTALAQVEQLCAQWASHQAELARVESQANEALQSAQTLQKGAQQMMHTAASDQQQIREAIKHMDKLSEEVGQAVTAEEALRAQAQALVEQVQEQLNTQEQVASDQAATTLRTEVMHDQITALDEQTQTRLSQLEDLRKQVAALLTENMSLQADLKEARQQAGDLSERAAQQMEGAENLNQKTEDHLTIVTEKVSQIDALVPQLSEDMARFSDLGKEYSDWESRLKSQSMSLKESEQKLKKLTKNLEEGLADVSRVRAEMGEFQTEFGGLKKVLAQVLQKFKGLEKSKTLLETKSDTLESDQAADRERIVALEAQVIAIENRPLPTLPESSKIDAVMQKVDKQAQFNEKVLAQFEHLSQGYRHLQTQVEALLPTPEIIANLTERVAALEARLAELALSDTGYSEQQASVDALTGASSDQQAQIAALTDAVQTIQAELAAYAGFAQASKAALAQGLVQGMPEEAKHQAAKDEAREAEAVQLPDQARQSAESQDAGGPTSTLETATHPEPHPQPKASASEAAPATEENTGSEVAEASGSSQHADQSSVADAEAAMPMELFDRPKAETTADSQESELDIFSQQLEKISLESEAWDRQFNHEDGQKKGGKSFLFSVAIGSTLMLGSLLFQEEMQQESSQFTPTFAHAGFEIQLNHPTHRIAGPSSQLASSTPTISQQERYTYQYDDINLALQWPVPDQSAGDQITYGLANNALYVQAPLHSPVVAIAPGEVLFSGVNEGQMGKMVIVQHQDALISVYGHLQDTYVDPGVQVGRGQVIARLGKSKWLEPRLYFEIRYEGRSEDPYLYFAS